MAGPIRKLRQKIRDAKSGSPLLRVLLNEFFIVGVFFLVWIIFLDNNNVMVWYRTRNRIADQQRRIEYLNEKITETENRLECLRSDRDTIERFAREQYLFHLPEEHVYLVPEE